MTSSNYMIRVLQLHYGLCFTICQHPAKFGGHTFSGGRKILFLDCHVTSCDQVVKGTCDFMDAFTSPQVTSLPSFIARNLAKEDMLRLQFVT